MAFLAVLLSGSLLFGNGFNLNSLGARAGAMGGAYIGLADDHSAVFWNPAGLIQVKGRILGFSIKGLIPFLRMKYENPDPPYPPDFAVETNFRLFLSDLIAYSFSLGDDFVAGISTYVPSDLGAKWGSSGPFGDSRSRLMVRAISPVAALRINKALSIGASLNLFYGTFNGKWPIESRQYEERSSGFGYGATVGLLFTPPDELLSLGITFKSGYRIRLRGDAEFSFLLNDPDISPRSGYSRDISWPMSIGFGVAVRPRNGLIVTTDFLWTKWNSVKKIDVEYENQDLQRFLDGYSSLTDIRLHWDHTLEFRLGGEYLLREGIALRAGYFYDDSPNSGVSLSFLLPSLPRHGFTTGFGYKKGKIQYDFGFEYLAGTKQQIPVGIPLAGIYDGNTLSLDFSITYRFK